MISPSQASAQLEMVDRILSRTDRTVHLSGWIYIIWGLAATLADIIFQLWVDHRISVAGLAIAGVAVLAAVAFMVFHLRDCAAEPSAWLTCSVRSEACSWHAGSARSS